LIYQVSDERTHNRHKFLKRIMLALRGLALPSARTMWAPPTRLILALLGRRVFVMIREAKHDFGFAEIMSLSACES
jgi:hypothetical protein